MAYGDFKDLLRRISSDKLFPNKALNIAKNPKYDVYQCVLGSIVSKLKLILKTNNYHKYFISQLLEILKSVRYTLLSWTAFGVLT